MKKEKKLIPPASSPVHQPGKNPGNPPGGEVAQPGKRIKITTEEFKRMEFNGLKIASLHSQIGVNRSRFLDMEKALKEEEIKLINVNNAALEEIKKKYKIIGEVADIDKKTLEIILK